MTTVAVLSGPERRRHWTLAEKHRIVEESLEPGTSVVEVARRHDIHPNLLHLWRRQARTGRVMPMRQPSEAQANEVQFASVAVTMEERISPEPSGAIEIEFASGTRLRIIGSVDAGTVSAAIAAASCGRLR